MNRTFLHALASIALCWPIANNTDAGNPRLHSLGAPVSHGRHMSSHRDPGRHSLRHGSHHGGGRHGWERSRRGSVGLYFGNWPGYLGGWPYGYSAYSSSTYVYPGINYMYYEPWGIYYNSITNDAQYWLPPIYAPAELTYGPRAIDRFLGVRRAPTVLPARATLPARDAARKATLEEIVGKLRKSNKTARDRAGRYVNFGDALFHKHRFHEALQRYKSAVDISPDFADAYYRKGYALIAVKQYAMATKAFKIALQLAPDVGRRFRLGDLYGAGRLAINAHLEELATEALEHPGDADLLMLVGLFLRDDGQPARARKFFVKAAELVGPDTPELKRMLDRIRRAGDAEEAVAGVDT